MTARAKARQPRIAVEYRPLGELVPYARNARTHSPAQVDQIAASIAEFGWTNPVLVDGASGIIAGHGRVLAAQKLGLAKVPCIELGHLTEAQRRAYVLVDNRLAENAGWDVEMLKVELQELQLAEFDLELLGWSEGELAELMAERKGGLTDEDEALETALVDGPGGKAVGVPVPASLTLRIQAARSILIRSGRGAPERPKALAFLRQVVRGEANKLVVQGVDEKGHPKGVRRPASAKDMDKAARLLAVYGG